MIEKGNIFYLTPLIESAIHNELRLLKMGIRRTEAKLKAYEERFGLDTGEFIKRYSITS